MHHNLNTSNRIQAVWMTLLSQLLIQILGLITGVLVARALGPAGRGELAAIIVWVSTLASLGNFGLPAAIAYTSARQPGKARQILHNAVLSAAGQSVLICVVGYLLASLIWGESEKAMQLAVLFFLAFVPMNILILCLNAMQQGLRSYGRFHLVRLCCPFTYLVGLCLVWWLDNLSLQKVLAINIFSNCLTLICAALLLRPLIRFQDSDLAFFDFASLRRDLRYGLSAHLSGLQPLSGLRIDILILTLLVSSHDLGLYSAAFAGASLVQAQGLAIGMIALPEVAHRRDTSTRNRLIAALASLTCATGLLTCLIALLWAEPLIRLVYGPLFTEAAPLLRLLVLSGLLASLSRVLADSMKGLGFPLSASKAELAGLAVGLPALVLLTLAYGMPGAAVAVIMATLTCLVVLLLVLRFRVGSLLHRAYTP
jgi:O-antigen/teichoic acid export membrane protein